MSKFKAALHDKRCTHNHRTQLAAERCTDLGEGAGIVEHDDGMERVVRYPSDGRCIIGISGNHRREGSTTVFWCIIGPVTCAGCCPTE